MFMRYSALFWAIVFSILSGELHVAYSQTLEDIAELVEMNGKIVQTMVGHLTIVTEYTEFYKALVIDTSPQETLTGGIIRIQSFQDTVHVFFASDGHRYRWDEEYLIVEDLIWKTQNAFDGEKVVTQILERGKNYEIPPHAQIYASMDEVRYDPRYDPRRWGFDRTEDGILLSDLFTTGHSGQFDVRVLSPDTIAGITHTVVRATNVQDSSYTITLWLNPQRNFLPSRIIYEGLSYALPSKPMAIMTCHDIEYSLLSQDIWFPKSAEIHSYVGNKGDKQTSHLYYVTRMWCEDDFLINVTLPDTLFNIRFVDGQHISDTRTGIGFRWKSK
ncbi:hypothetical protein KAX02_03915 [candidate division WOR-3 bacterium]|nr:hypothetical protein [candidate division WOR-3 bacterium]